MIYIVPIFFIGVVLYSICRGNDTYHSFVLGVKEALRLVVDIFPYILAVFILLELFRVSGLDDIFVNFTYPIFSFFGIPREVIGLIFLKNFSGSGSLAVLSDIYKTYGVTSYISKVASCIVGSSEAVFYITAVYFSKTKVVRFRYGIVVAILSSFIGTIFACFICRYI